MKAEERNEATRWHLRFLQLVGHSPVGSSYMYPEGEFLCIVSKQYDRGIREDQNNHVSERVKVREETERERKRNLCLFFSFPIDFTRTWLTHVIIPLNNETFGRISSHLC